jgi:hypothetical protein
VGRTPTAGVVRLRPHHLLCLVAFQGEGYSPGFIERTRALQRALVTGGTVIELVRGPDDLCDGCPELKEECISDAPDSGVERLDRAASALLGVPSGRHRAEDLLRALNDAFTPERGYGVCAGCSWLPKMDCPRVIAARLRELFPERPGHGGGRRA